MIPAPNDFCNLYAYTITRRTGMTAASDGIQSTMKT